jgi:multidrug efflux system membrane fusion protein
MLNGGQSHLVQPVSPILSMPTMRFALPILLCALVLQAGCRKKGAAEGGARGPGGPVPVNVGNVVARDVPVELRTVGNVQALASVALRAQVAGELIKVHFEEGQDVKKGDPLFTIDPTVFETQLAQAEANLAKNRIQAANAQRDLVRAAELAKKGAVAGEQLDAARAQAESLEATVRADEAAVEIAKVQLGYTHVVSPIDGRTGTLRLNVGNLVRANDTNPLVTLNQIEPIYVQFSLPEEHLPIIRARSKQEELPVFVMQPSSTEPIAEGKLTFIQNEVDIATGTIQLKGTFENKDRTLWPGQFVDVVLRLSVQKGAIVMPGAALMNGQNGQQVFVVKPDSTAELRSVTVDRTVGEEVVVSSGVSAGERVVTNGQLRVIPGSKLAVRDGIAPPGRNTAAKPAATPIAATKPAP